jgi:transcriptional regulator with GAF, ATPase, and Fis domain
VIVLKVIEGNARGKVYTLADAVVTIGRAPGNNVVLADYHLSGEHGQIFAEGDHYVYRDLRSTNGSQVSRDSELIAVDASRDWEVSLRSGDTLCLGDPTSPVVVRIELPEEPRSSSGNGIGDRVIASRSIIDLPAVTHRVEHDPGRALRIYKALQPLASRLEMGATLEAITEATFELLPQATHVSILLRSEGDKDRFTVALSRTRSGRAPSHSDAGGSGRVDTVRASRAVLRRVLADRAAVLTGNAQKEMSSSESILGGQILSMLAVPLWQGDEIRGLIQADNRSSAGMFDEGDLEIALLLGSHAALALDNASLVSRLQIAEERLRGENEYLKERQLGERTFDDIIGDSSAMKQVFDALRKVVDTRATVCVEGETGTGKELIASAIHYQSRRHDKMFVAQNCAALPENLLESELFGHKKGAFTSADTDKKGLFEIADAGTLFLDEVGEMPLSLQAKLLRVLQEGTIRPVGATAERAVDVRIITATNRDLADEVEKGRFRQDLYYRLMVFPIRLPPLRERREDIPLLADHFLRKYVREYRGEVAGFSQECLDAMAAYQWPGNIRELENEIQRLVIQTESGAWIEVGDLSPRLRKVEGTINRIAPKKGTLKEMMEQVERWLLAEALREHDNNKTRTAQTLGITREGLHKKLSKFGM